MKLTSESILKTLRVLGNKPDDIAASLRRKRVRGSPCESYNCPIANYLKRRYGLEHFLADDVLASTRCIVVGAACRVETPRVVVRFMNGFDKGKYPYLISK
jgi:hypothetical protein